MNSCFQANILAVLAMSPRSVSTYTALGGLGRWAGLLPFRRRILAPDDSLLVSKLRAFGVWQELIGGEALSPYQ